MRALWRALRQTSALLGSQRKLWLPFFVGASIEGLLIGLVWLAPHPPFSTILAPPLRYVFGERMLHYPWHLWFLYDVMRHTAVATSMLVGAFMTGLACAMVRQVHEGAPLSLRAALAARHVRYGTVVSIWLVSWVLAQLLMRGWSLVAAKAMWAFWGGISSVVILQALVVYAIPAAVFERLAWWKALRRSVQETLRYPLSTLVVSALPSASVIAFSVIASPAHVVRWMMQTTPELALAFVVGRLLLGMVADACLTVAAAHLWWSHRLRLASDPVDPSRPSPTMIRPTVTLQEGPAVA